MCVFWTFVQCILTEFNMCACVFVCACVRACVCACVHVCQYSIYLCSWHIATKFLFVDDEEAALVSGMRVFVTV